LHVPLIHLAALGIAYARYGQVGFVLDHPILADPSSIPQGNGFGLPVVYLVWLGVLVVLYPACRWFAEVKRRRQAGWLSYL